MKIKPVFIAAILLTGACKQQQITVGNDKASGNENLPEISINSTQKNTGINQNYHTYRYSDTIFFDLIHTKLDIKFNFQKKHVLGIAEIKLKPWLYPTTIVKLNANRFDIHEIALINPENKIPLKYNYNDSIISIQLDKTYRADDTITIFINYTAKPDEILSSGSWAIRDNKGLYFIDTDTDRPQIWTQGETQSNSGWFPTIDSPIQNMSQEIFLTVPIQFKTLSNGLLVSSLPNTDGTRTDYWKQDKPHAPYLVMVAVGNFEIIEDYWRDIPVFVYAEEKDIPKAKSLFLKTPKMIELFSRLFAYDYPWDKYHQIVVKNFVSGAMENTGAVVFGDYVLDYVNEEQRLEYECVVAHELSHHWFGNLVTCESWANLPLNEAFATYMEYIWIENEYNRTLADIHLEQDLINYSFERFFKDENLIRFHYKHRDDMFDAHSYQKGALVMHMLRYTVGDNAFWKAIHIYLNENAYRPVEIHNLRLAFEKAVGIDLNWFFDQWFLNNGIPELNITYAYDPISKTASVSVSQIQNLNIFPLYKIPTYVDIYYKDKVLHYPILINKQHSVFNFPSETKPLYINFDPENALLCRKIENYTTDEYINIIEKASLYKDINEALDRLNGISSPDLNKALLKLADHEWWKFRLEALKRINMDKSDPLFNQYLKTLQNMSDNDPDTRVKRTAKNLLNSRMQ